MRKQYKEKARSCPLCKPNKMGRENRWTVKERDAIKRAEEEARESTGPVHTGQ